MLSLRARRITAGVTVATLLGLAILLLLHDPDSIREQHEGSMPRVTGVRAEGTASPPVLLGTEPLGPGQDGANPSTGAVANPVAADVIQGLVIDDLTGEPVANARVFRWGSETFIPRSDVTVTDQYGRFAMSAKAEAIACRANGYLPTVLATIVDQADALTLRLLRGSSIRGRVTDDLGAPIPGARVWAYLPGNAAAWPHGETWCLATEQGHGGTAATDAEGRFQIAGLDPSRSYYVASSCPFYTCIAEDKPAFVPGDAAQDVHLELVPVGELGLVVVEGETGNRFSTR